MTTTVHGPSPGRAGAARSVPPKRLAWLDGELARWQADGYLDAAAAAGIRAQYTASRRLSLARLLLVLGGAFVGVGLLWLVAANIDALSPTVRFLGVVVLWLGAVAGAEALAVRRDRSDDTSGGAGVGAARMLAALIFGAVVFQAAQSLQVPAYSSTLLAVWAGGAVLYAYAATAVAPLLVGVVTGVGWYLWVVVERSESAAVAAVALLVAAVLAAAVAAAHSSRWLPEFAAPWRVAGALLALSGLFLAAFPQMTGEETATPSPVRVGVVVALAAAAAAAVVADRTGRLEVAVAVAVAVVGVLVVRWQPADATDAAELSGEGLLRAVVAIVVYLVTAAWFTVLGVLRDTRGITQVATAALVLFTVVQSFAVFEPILSGAALFLFLGAVLAATGYVVDRGRRRLVADVREATS